MLPHLYYSCSNHYIDILKRLIKSWSIDKLTDLNDEAEKARDYVWNLPARLERIALRMKPATGERRFKWVNPDGMMMT